jgi:alkaline phosphatase D
MVKRDDKFTRRDLLKGTGALAATFGMPACGSDPEVERPVPDYQYDGPLGPEDLFQHGVASGDPLPNGILLWTRVTTAGSDPLQVWWEIAVDVGFSRRVQVGEVSTDGDRDFTVKVDVMALESGRTYYYRFKALGRTSPVGRTRTAPSGPVDRLRFAVASCSSLAHGYFHAYRAIAERADLDAVIHLGDYIYEYGNGQYGNIRTYEPAHEILTLADYRTRHSQYKRDPDLQEVHRQHPFIVVWDDHESANNSAKIGAQNHDPATEGSWEARKAVALQAYAEWMPIRDFADGRIFRALSFGELADLILLDTRLWGRNVIDASSIPLGPPPEPDPTRTLLGDDQATWLEEQLDGSNAQWKLIGQQVMVANLIIAEGQIANLDQWHGYPESRDRFLTHLADTSASNVVVLTGDIHSSWANELVGDPGDPTQYNPDTGEGALAVEFVAPAITSPGIPEQFLPLFDSALPLNPHIRFVEATLRGYIVLDVTSERAQAAWYLYDGVEQPEGATETLREAWAVNSGETRLNKDAEAAPARANAPAPAP